MIRLVSFHTSLFPVDAGILDPLTNADNPFLGNQNMVDVGLFKEKTKVLTSAKSREARTVDPKIQISADKYREIRKHRN